MTSDTASPALPSHPPTIPANSAVQPNASANEIDIDYFMKVQLRVATVEAAEALPKSKKLLKLAVDLGPELGKRQILAGIAQYYPPETLVGKQIVVVANLKPAQLMGEVSQGMLLAASNADGTALQIIQPAAPLPQGSVVR